MMPKTWLETLSRDYRLQDMLPKTGELLCMSAEPLNVSEAAASKPASQTICGKEEPFSNISSLL